MKNKELVEVKFGNINDYNIDIGELEKVTFDKKVAVITNPTVSGLHLGYLLNCIQAKELAVITVPDGEEFKNMSTVEDILDNLFNQKFNRNSLLIAFGGGVIGDMVGFTASIYQRGIDFIQVPTTLLSQVDSSVGGKTGVNNKFGKNLIGAFYQPKRVFIDPYFLTTLKPKEYSAGIAEIIKISVMFDKDFFEWIENHDLTNKNDVVYAIKRSVELKRDVVVEDEKEKGERAKLNYGHTFCHIIEKETNYTGFLHGEAVSIGIIMANILAVNLEMITQDQSSRIQKQLEKYNLPTTYKIKDIEAFYDLFFLDKKATDNKIKFILPTSLGTSVIRDDISKDEIIKVLKKFV
jgi:3-dehydroquinate synthase